MNMVYYYYSNSITNYKTPISKGVHAMNDFIESVDTTAEVNYYDNYSGDSFDVTEYADNYNEYKEAYDYE